MGTGGPERRPSAPRAVVHDGAAAFLERAGEWLMAAEDEHNLILGLAHGLAGTAPAPGREAPLFATVEREGRVVGCFFRTPPYKAGLSRMPLDAAPEVARCLAERYATLPAVFGPADVAEAVGRAWCWLTGGAWAAGTPQRMYRLDTVVEPTGVAGRARTAEPADLPVADTWAGAFADEAGSDLRPPPGAGERWIRQGDLFLWDDGGPVCMAVATGRTPGGARIGYVYTPPERRGRGYATALTAAVSRRVLEEGRRFCVLYTDLTNPTSNAIYPRVGYRPLCDVVDVVLTPR